MYLVCMYPFLVYILIFFIEWGVEQFCVLVLGVSCPFLHPFVCCIFLNFIFGYLPEYWCIGFFHVWASCCSLFGRLVSLFIALSAYNIFFFNPADPRTRTGISKLISLCTLIYLFISSIYLISWLLRSRKNGVENHNFPSTSYDKLWNSVVQCRRHRTNSKWS